MERLFGHARQQVDSVGHVVDSVEGDAEGTADLFEVAQGGILLYVLQHLAEPVAVVIRALLGADEISTEDVLFEGDLFKPDFLAEPLKSQSLQQEVDLLGDGAEAIFKRLSECLELCFRFQVGYFAI